jgi:hypothetical protein
MPTSDDDKMKRFLRIFELSNSEQRVVLVVVLVLIAVAFVGYERRVRHLPIQSISATEAKPSPTVGQIEEDR